MNPALINVTAGAEEGLAAESGRGAFTLFTCYMSRTVNR